MTAPAAADWDDLRRQLAPLARDQRRTHLRIDQRQRWLRRTPLAVEDYRQNLSELLDPGLALDLIASERALRAEIGESISTDEYRRRFPEFASDQMAPMPGALDRTDTRDQTSPGAERPRPAVSLPEVPGYEVLAFLDRGGQGDVYRARHHHLDREVALKILRRDADGADALARFRREGRFSAQFDHPHIVKIFDCDEYDGRLFFSMELVEGGSLKDRIRQGPMPPRAAAELLLTLASTMHVAHAQGVVHRDIKPGNVLFTADGTPKITDFGLAKRLDDSVGVTTTGAILGTARYMAPEQAAGKSKQVSPATDVYALGVVLYECVTGKPPFDGEDWLEVLIQVRKEAPVPPRELCPELPPALEAVCLRCLEKDPADRYAAAHELAEALRGFLENPDGGGYEPPENTVKGFTPPARQEEVAPVTMPRPALPEDYELLGEIGRGGRGIVYQARQRSRGRVVALKVLPVAGPLTDRDWHLQCQEAQAVLGLQHPHLTPVYDLGLLNGVVFIASEFLAGGSLYRKLAGQPQPARAAAELVEQLARVLGFVHQNGEVHRDVNPANVLFAPVGSVPGVLGGPFPNSDALYGVPKLTDFDCVRRLGRDPASADETSLGPPSVYQAPEQEGGKNRQVGPPADIWALGALLYEMLTGKPPFRGRTIVELLQQVRELSPVPPSRLQPKVPRVLETICLRCLRKPPRRRYADGIKLAEDLRWFREGRPLADHHPRLYDRQHFRRKE